jgi:hypothetical protein
MENTIAFKQDATLARSYDPLSFDKVQTISSPTLVGHTTSITNRLLCTSLNENSR